MKLLIAVGTMFFAACAGEAPSSGSGYPSWTVGAYRPSMPQVPKLGGYAPLKSVAVGFRKYEVAHPEGVWVVALDGGKDPISVRTPSGKVFTFSAEWYPEEGGADAAAVYGFMKGDETLIILEGTSDLTSEETWIRLSGGKLTGLKRYAVKGGGMGPEMPGREPKYRVYPPE